MRTAEKTAWVNMKKRCLNPQPADRHLYQGIAVCERWLHSFENFLADVGYRPSPKHSLDRFPDNKGNYEPGNVRWATQEEQANNKRNNVRLETPDGQFTLSQAARFYGLSVTALKQRMKMNLPVDQLLSKPVPGRWLKRRRGDPKYPDMHPTVDNKIVRNRLRIGWDLERAKTTPRLTRPWGHRLASDVLGDNQ